MTMRPSRGFTVLEMIVVIAIISLLATVGLSSFAYAREKAWDARRVTDVSNIAKALLAHNLDHGHWIENGYGEWDGNGYFNVPGRTNGGPSMAARLVEAGYFDYEIVDPSGAIGSDEDVNYNGYMKYQCPLPPERPTAVYIYARMESEPLSDTATDGTCCPECDTLYNMNYYHVIPVIN